MGQAKYKLLFHNPAEDSFGKLIHSVRYRRMAAAAYGTIIILERGAQIIINVAMLIQYIKPAVQVLQGKVLCGLCRQFNLRRGTSAGHGRPVPCRNLLIIIEIIRKL